MTTAISVQTAIPPLPADAQLALVTLHEWHYGLRVPVGGYPADISILFFKEWVCKPLIIGELHGRIARPRDTLHMLYDIGLIDFKRTVAFWESDGFKVEWILPDGRNLRLESAGPDPQTKRHGCYVFVDKERIGQYWFPTYVDACRGLFLTKDGGIAALRTMAAHDQPKTELVDPVCLARIVEVVGRKAGRSDKLADKMKRLNYRVDKRADRYHCQRADAIALFPKYKERIKEI